MQYCAVCRNIVGIIILTRAHLPASTFTSCLRDMIDSPALQGSRLLVLKASKYLAFASSSKPSCLTHTGKATANSELPCQRIFMSLALGMVLESTSSVLAWKLKVYIVTRRADSVSHAIKAHFTGPEDINLIVR